MFSILLSYIQFTIAISRSESRMMMIIDKFFFSIRHKKWNFPKQLKLGMTKREMQVSGPTKNWQRPDKKRTWLLSDWFTEKILGEKNRMNWTAKIVEQDYGILKRVVLIIAQPGFIKIYHIFLYGAKISQESSQYLLQHQDSNGGANVALFYEHYQGKCRG